MKGYYIHFYYITSYRIIHFFSISILSTSFFHDLLTYLHDFLWFLYCCVSCQRSLRRLMKREIEKHWINLPKASKTWAKKRMCNIWMQLRKYMQRNTKILRVLWGLWKPSSPHLLLIHRAEYVPQKRKISWNVWRVEVLLTARVFLITIVYVYNKVWNRRDFCMDIVLFRALSNNVMVV